VESAQQASVAPATVAFTKKPVKVVVTGAAGNIAYAILFMIGQGKLLGDDQPIELRLLDIPAMSNAIKGVIMELSDCAYPVLTKIVGTTDYKTAFENIDIALLIGAKPRGPGMQRKDLLTANGAIFAGQGKALNQYASRNVKVCVVGNPANTNAMIAMTNAPDLPKTAFSAMTRLDQNRAASQLADRLKVPVDDVKNVIIWGNHSKTQVPDVNHGVIESFPFPSLRAPIRAAVNNNAYLDSEFMSTVQDRGAAIIKAHEKSSAASAASSCVDHVRDWVLGTKKGEYVSMGVYSDGKTYGVPEGLIFSFPCQCYNGQYHIVKGLPIDANTQKLIAATTKELQEEKAEASSL
jgi:malate dehydrogenase